MRMCWRICVRDLVSSHGLDIMPDQLLDGDWWIELHHCELRYTTFCRMQEKNFRTQQRERGGGG